MTILTHQASEKPKETEVLINPQTVVRVTSKQKQAAAEVNAAKQRKIHEAIQDLIQRRRRRFLAMNVVVGLASLLVIVTGIFGGMYLYKWLSYSAKVSMQGSCQVRYHEESAQQQVAVARNPPRPRSTKSPQIMVDPAFDPYRLSQSEGSFEEKYNILNDEQELLQVPQAQFGFYVGVITIIMDFAARQTAFVDIARERCFVKPLDPNVPAPRDAYDVFRRISDGTYVPNVCLIHKHYIARQPAMTSSQLRALGSDVIRMSCAPYATYQLVPRDEYIPAPTTPQTRRYGGAEDWWQGASRKRDRRDAEEPVDLGLTDEDTHVVAKKTEEAQVQRDEELVLNTGFTGDESVEMAIITFEKDV